MRSAFVRTALATAGIAASITTIVPTPARAAPAVQTTTPDKAPLPRRASTITGVVLDSATGRPLIGAHVRLLELERHDETHADGRFLLTNIRPGRYTLSVQRIGYRRGSVAVSLRADSTLDFTIRLVANPIDLPEIAVTSGLGAQESEYALQPTTVVEGRNLDRHLGATLAETLDHEAGISAASMGPVTGRPIIRGLGGDRVVMLEDGARTGDMSYSSPDHAVSSDPFSAERLEVVRGPAALLYGSNALSGVVNIIRNEIPTSRADGVHGRMGMQLQSASRSGILGGHATAPLGRFMMRVEGSGRDARDLHTPEGRLDNTGARTYTAAFGIGRAEKWGHAGLSYRHYNSSYGIPGGFVGGHAEGVAIDMRRNAFRGELHRQLGGTPWSDLEVSGGVVHYAHEEIEHGGLLGTAFRLLTADANVIARHDRLGPFSSGGTGVRTQLRDYAFGGSLHTPNARELTAAAFFLEQYDAGRLRLQAGGRFDWTRIEPLGVTGTSTIGDIRPRTFGAVSGSVGALMRLGDGIGVGLNVGRAFRTPDVNDLFSEGPHLAVYREEIGNPNLGVETALGIDAFVRVSRSWWRGELAVFRNDITNFIYPRETGDTSQRALPIAQYTGLDAELIGAEGRIEASPLPNVAATIVGSYVRGTLSGLDQPLPLIPPFKGNFDVRYEHPGYFVGGGTRLAARQNRLGEFETSTPGYAVAYLSGGHTWQWAGRLHTLTLRVDNLLNQSYREHLSRIKTIMPEAGRNVVALYRVDF